MPKWPEREQVAGASPLEKSEAEAAPVVEAAAPESTMLVLPEGDDTKTKLQRLEVLCENLTILVTRLAARHGVLVHAELGADWLNAGPYSKRAMDITREIKNRHGIE